MHQVARMHRSYQSGSGTFEQRPTDRSHLIQLSPLSCLMHRSSRCSKIENTRKTVREVSYFFPPPGVVSDFLWAFFLSHDVFASSNGRPKAIKRIFLFLFPVTEREKRERDVDCLTTVHFVPRGKEREKETSSNCRHPFLSLLRTRSFWVSLYFVYIFFILKVM